MYIVLRQRDIGMWEPVSCGTAAEMSESQAQELAERYAKRWPLQTFALANIETVFTSKQRVVVEAYRKPEAIHALREIAR